MYTAKITVHLYDYQKDDRTSLQLSEIGPKFFINLYLNDKKSHWNMITFHICLKANAKIEMEMYAKHS